MTDTMREEFESWAATFFDGATPEMLKHARCPEGTEAYILEGNDNASIYLTATYLGWKAARDASPDVQGEPVYFWREIGETDWMECRKDWYWKCVNSPEHDTKLLYTAPQPAEHHPTATREEITKWRDDALEQAAQICDRYGLDAYGAGHDIRVLKSDYKFAPHNTHKSTSDDMCGAEIAAHRKGAQP